MKVFHEQTQGVVRRRHGFQPAEVPVVCVVKAGVAELMAVGAEMGLATTRARWAWLLVPLTAIGIPKCPFFQSGFERMGHFAGDQYAIYVFWRH